VDVDRSPLALVEPDLDRVALSDTNLSTASTGFDEAAHAERGLIADE